MNQYREGRAKGEGRGKIGTKAGFWEEQELEWGLTGTDWGKGLQGHQLGEGTSSLSQTDPKQIEHKPWWQAGPGSSLSVLRPEGGVRS